MGWLKSFRKNEEPAVPDASGAPASAGAARQSSGSGGSKRYVSGGDGSGRSTHDIAMAAAVLSSAGPSRPPPLSSPPPRQPHSQDEDVAMAYRLALEEQASAQGWPQQPRTPGAPSFQGFQVAPLPQGHPASGSRQHDVSMATALAESKFAARQAEELERNSKQVYLAAVIQALEASLVSADYDAVLRDIKLWTIDLSAASDEVQAALAAARRRREEVAARLEAADPTDEDKASKLGWLAQQLPLAEARLEELALRVTPVVVAVLELRELREHVAAAAPPLAQAEARRDAIIATLFKDMSAAGLGGASTAGAAAPTDIRDLVAALVHEAQRLPPAPAVMVPALAQVGALAGAESPVPSASGTGSVSADLDEAAREQHRAEKEKRRQRREEHNRRKEAAQAAAEKAAAEELRRVAQEQREGEERERLRRQAEAEAAAEEERRRQQRQREQLEEEERAQREAEAVRERQRRLAEIEAAAEAEQRRVKEEERAQREAAEEMRRRQQQEQEKREREARRRQEEEASAAVQREQERQREEQLAKDERQRQRERKEEEDAQRKALAAAAAVTQSAGNRSVQEPPLTPAVPASAPRAPSSARSTHSTSTAPPTRGAASPAPATPPSHSAGAKPAGTGTASFKEFNLSVPRAHYKSSGTKPTPGDAIRRVPSLFSLHHALGKDEEGAVAQAVGWDAGKGATGGSGGRLRRSLHWLSPPGGAGKKQQQRGSGAGGALPPAPAELASFTPQAMDEVVDFVAAHGGLPREDGDAAPADGAVTAVDEPGGRAYGPDRWGTMCEAAALHRTLAGMAEALDAWEIDPGAGPLAAAHRLADFMGSVAGQAGKVAQAHDPLRARMARHGVPWPDSALSDVRWAAQGAAAALMRFALDCCSDAEKAKGSWQRQAVLQPLGHAVMGVFPVHQFAGGFSSGTTALADQLVERTVHYARLIDPKWLRSTRLVAA